MTARPSFAVLALAVILLAVALIGVIVAGDARANRWRERATLAEAQLADVRRERTMLLDALKGLAEGTATEPESNR